METINLTKASKLEKLSLISGLDPSLYGLKDITQSMKSLREDKIENGSNLLTDLANEWQKNNKSFDCCSEVSQAGADRASSS